MPKRKATITKSKAAAARTKTATRTGTKAVSEEKVIGFRADSQAARMYKLLADGKPRTIQEIHKVLSDTTESHVRNGLLYALRKRGSETGQFHIVTTPEHKLQWVKGPKPKREAVEAKASSKTKSAGPTEAGAEAGD